MHHPSVHQANVPGLARDRHGAPLQLWVELGVHFSGEFPVLKVTVAFAVRSRNHPQATIFLRHVVEQQQGRHHVVVCVRIVGMVLMKIHPRLHSGKLDVELAVVKRHIRADQVGHHVRDHPVNQHLVVRRRNVHRIGHPPQLGMFGAMPRLQIEPRLAV